MAGELNYQHERPARALVRYPGSKWSLACWIVDQLPPHRTYAEPFFGSGAIFFSKAPAEYEVLNDLDHRVVNFFQVVRERGAELAQAIALTPWARAEYEAAYTETAEALEHPLDALKALRQWVVWRYESRSGKPKPAKPPYQPSNGRAAYTNRPATWGTYAQARARYQHGGWHGLGFVFTAGDPYCGVDLDNCRVPLTGEIAPWAWHVVEALHSYTEISPSGTGLHILVKATLPGHIGRKERGIEVYDALRYFTLTGQRLAELPATVEERQAEIEALYATLAPAEKETLPAGRPAPRLSLSRSDKEVLARARHAPNGGKFCALYDAGRIDGYRDPNTGEPDHSAADFALMVLLAYWTNGNAAQMARLFQASALYRPERWEQSAGSGHTYGEVTIYNALRLSDLGRAAPPKRTMR